MVFDKTVQVLDDDNDDDALLIMQQQVNDDPTSVWNDVYDFFQNCNTNNDDTIPTASSLYEQKLFRE
jgi:hypothetical protein